MEIGEETPPENLAEEVEAAGQPALAIPEPEDEAVAVLPESPRDPQVLLGQTHDEAWRAWAGIPMIETWLEVDGRLVKLL